MPLPCARPLAFLCRRLPFHVSLPHFTPCPTWGTWCGLLSSLTAFPPLVSFSFQLREAPLGPSVILLLVTWGRLAGQEAPE